MQELQAGAADDLMAAWRASGGALEAMAAEPETGDDGLAATAMTDPYRCPLGDDGLHATGPSFGFQCNYGDDGLHAAQTLDPALGAECFNGDDGLKAAMNSEGGVPCFADDGLGATAANRNFPYCGDDGLQAAMGIEG